MSRHEKVEALLAGAARLAQHREARAAWVIATDAAWREAQRRMDERCDAAVDRVSEEEFERLCDKEEARVDVFRAPMKLAAEKDLWPKELYFGCV
jgi:hypothetical protein